MSPLPKSIAKQVDKNSLPEIEKSTKWVPVSAYAKLGSLATSLITYIREQQAQCLVE